jgi:hypothetical protein
MVPPTWPPGFGYLVKAPYSLKGYFVKDFFLLFLLFFFGLGFFAFFGRSTRGQICTVNKPRGF